MVDKITVETFAQHRIDTDIDTGNIIDGDTTQIFKSSELLKIREDKINKLYARYNSYYKLCVEKIKNTNNKHRTDIIYRVPVIIFGEPDYKASECLEFIKHKLDKEEFITMKINNTALFISWKFAGTEE